MPYADDFASVAVGADSPATKTETIAPNDGNDLGFATRAIYVGGGGNINAVMFGGMTQLFTAVPAGFILPVRVVRVLATGTTATNMVGLR